MPPSICIKYRACFGVLNSSPTVSRFHAKSLKRTQLENYLKFVGKLKPVWIIDTIYPLANLIGLHSWITLSIRWPND